MTALSDRKPEPSRRFLLTPDEAAEALAISARKLWSMTAAKEIPSIRIGRSVRYAVDDLLEWIKAQKITD